MEEQIFDIILAFVGALPCLVVLRFIFEWIRSILFKG